MVDHRARSRSSRDELDVHQRLDPSRLGNCAPIGVAEHAVSVVAPRIDLAHGTEREAVIVASGDAHDALVLHRRHQRGWDGHECAGIRVPVVPQERLADLSHCDIPAAASEVQAACSVYKEAGPITTHRERSFPTLRVVEVALQQVRYPRKRPFR